MGTTWIKPARFGVDQGFRVQYCNANRSRKAMDSVSCLEELKELARCKFGFDDGDDLQVVLSTTGAEIDDDAWLPHLNPDVLLDVINRSQGEAWSNPPSPPGQSFLWSFVVLLLSTYLSQPRSGSSGHQMSDRNSGVFNQSTYNIQAKHVQLGNKTVIHANGNQSPGTME